MGGGCSLLDHDDFKQTAGEKAGGWFGENGWDAPSLTPVLGGFWMWGRSAAHLDGTGMMAAVGTIALDVFTLGTEGDIARAEMLTAKAALPELRISAGKYPELAENISNAQLAGHPSVLTHGGNSTANRAAALDGVPNIKGLSRDEYPFASSMQGGRGSWVGHVPPSQQNAQGGLIKNFLQQNGISAGDQYRVLVTP